MATSEEIIVELQRRHDAGKERGDDRLHLDALELIEQLQTEKENLRIYAGGLENAQGYLDERVANEEAENKRLREEKDEAWANGVREYAWWKDGVQYVGTCGTTLEQALKDKE